MDSENLSVKMFWRNKSFRTDHLETSKINSGLYKINMVDDDVVDDDFINMMISLSYNRPKWSGLDT